MWSKGWTPRKFLTFLAQKTLSGAAQRVVFGRILRRLWREPSNLKRLGVQWAKPPQIFWRFWLCKPCSDLSREQFLVEFWAGCGAGSRTRKGWRSSGRSPWKFLTILLGTLVMRCPSSGSWCNSDTQGWKNCSNFYILIHDEESQISTLGSCEPRKPSLFLVALFMS